MTRDGRVMVEAAAAEKQDDKQTDDFDDAKNQGSGGIPLET